MKIKIKLIGAFEALIILILIASVVHTKLNETKADTNKNNSGLLSPRVYAGILKPKSFLLTNFEPLRERLGDYIKQQKLNVSIYVESLRNGAQMGINEDIGLYPASLNKLPVAILVMDRIEKGKLSLDTMLQINNSDRNDPTSEFYKSKESKVTVKVLIEKMLKESDNTAFYTLLRLIDKRDLEILLNYYSLNPESTYFNPKKQNEHSNFVTPIEISNIFTSLYLSTVLTSKDSEYVLSLLTATDFDIKKIALLPENVRVAHKFGSYYANGAKYFHDCGIIYSGELKILYCIMTKDLDEPEAIKNVGIFVHSVYTYTNATREQLDTFRNQGSIGIYS